MLSEHFITRLNSAPGKIILRLSPRLDQLSPEFQRYDEPFLPYGKAAISSARGIVISYMFDFSAYLTLGAAGIIALERTLAYASTSGITTILDGKFASPDYVPALNHGELMVDSVTVSDIRYCAAFEDAGITPIVQSDIPHPGAITLLGDQVLIGDDCWHIVSADRVTRGSMNFTQTLREYVLKQDAT